MSLEKAILHKKERRKPFRGSARWDTSCRHGGSCSYCQSNRLHGVNKATVRLDGQIDEAFCDWNMPDGNDVLSDLYESQMEKLYK